MNPILIHVISLFVIIIYFFMICVCICESSVSFRGSYVSKEVNIVGFYNN